MKSLRLTLFFLAFVALILPVMSQEKKTGSPSAAPKYDPATEVTVKGVVEKLKDYACPVGGAMGAHLTVRTSTEVLEVHLAPSRFLSEYGIAFAKGDEVEVRGSKLTYQGSPALLARRIDRGNDVFSFRDAKGRPLW